MEKTRVKFRPSSHSDDYIVLATYKSEHIAEKVQKALSAFLTSVQNGKILDSSITKNLPGLVDWFPHKSAVHRKGKTVTFVYDSTGRIPYIERLMTRLAHPTEIYWEPQKLIIQMRVPKTITPETPPNIVALVISSIRAEEITWLNQYCGQAKSETSYDPKYHYLTWHYAGTRIYSKYTYVLTLSHEIELRKRSDLHVTETPWGEPL